jgi:predicted TIM-barrel fold metal-dependent hydrolase
LNPLREYALAELQRCAHDPRLRRGIKLHFANSDVQLDNPVHVERLKRVFRAANQHHMAIVIHLRASISKRRPYGTPQARVFLEELLPLAPDVVVQVAHLAGSGSGEDDPAADEVMGVLAEAVGKHDLCTSQLWFDVSAVARGVTPADALRIVSTLRRVGLDRILYGSDGAIEGNRPAEAWTAFRRLPLTEAEFIQIAGNVAPYLR